MQQFPIELSDNFSITEICDLYTDKPETKPVIMRFSFYGEECHICFNFSQAQEEWLSFSSLEAPDDLSGSFEEEIEYKFWPEVKKVYHDFINSELSQWGEIAP